MTMTMNESLRTTLIPIYDHRTVVGHAKTARQAERIVRALLQTIPRGWKVTVRMRDTNVVNLPTGWIYSVHP